MLTLRQFLSFRLLPTLDRAHSLNMSRALTSNALAFSSKLQLQLPSIDGVEHKLELLLVSGAIYHVLESWSENYSIDHWSTVDPSDFTKEIKAINGYVVLSKHEIETMQAIQAI